MCDNCGTVKDLKHLDDSDQQQRNLKSAIRSPSMIAMQSEPSDALKAIQLSKFAYIMKLAATFGCSAPK